jgi:rhomboid protease GluP
VPVCPTCGKSFSGFSFGSDVATECRDCRKKKAGGVDARITDASAASSSREGSVRGAARPVITLTIIGLNALVYAAMSLSGASWVQPTAMDAIRWGADFGPLTLSGEWWRLLTSTFVHFGIIHIGLNLWCLWNLGAVLEPLMGRKRFCVMYLASGLAASMVSVAWNPWRVSAGASGAIFGVAGAFVSYLALKKTSFDGPLVRKNLKSMAIFIIYNLVRGLGGMIDNSAHVGGLIAGLILGASIPPVAPASVLEGAEQSAALVSGRAIDAGADHAASEDRVAWTVAAFSAVVLLAAGVWVHGANAPVVRYGKAVKLVRAGRLDAGSAEMQQAVQLDSRLFIGQALLGEWMLEQQNPGAAVSALEQAAELVPDDAETQHNLALAYLGAGNTRSALVQIDEALGNEKDDPWRGEFILGMAHARSGENGPASQHLRTVIQLKPDFYEAQDALAQIDLQQGQISEARSLYSGVLKSHPQDSVAISDSNLLASAGTQRPAPSQLAPLTIPYEKLVMKSEYWPLFP